MMISYGLYTDFPLPLRQSKPKIAQHLQRSYVDLMWVRCHEPDFIKHFNLKETHEIPGLVSLRATVSLEGFLEYHGHTYAEALLKFRLLQSFHNDREERSNKGAYSGVNDLIAFYDELASGNRPKTVQVSFIEHY